VAGFDRSTSVYSPPKPYISTIQDGGRCRLSQSLSAGQLPGGARTERQLLQSNVAIDDLRAQLTQVCSLMLLYSSWSIVTSASTIRSLSSPLRALPLQPPWAIPPSHSSSIAWYETGHFFKRVMSRSMVDALS